MAKFAVKFGPFSTAIRIDDPNSIEVEAEDITFEPESNSYFFYETAADDNSLPVAIIPAHNVFSITKVKESK